MSNTCVCEVARIGSVGIRLTCLDSCFENIDDHRHVHDQCARPRCWVHVFDFCHDWTKYLQWWWQRRANLHQSAVHLSGMHQCWMHVSNTDGRTDRRRWYVCNLVCSTVGNWKNCRQTHWLKAMYVPKWRKNRCVRTIKNYKSEKWPLYELIHDILVWPSWNNLWCTNYSSVRTNTRL